VLPEKWNLLAGEGPREARSQPLAEAIEPPRGWARELGVHLLAGSLAVREPGAELGRNRSLLIAPDGEVLASYDKVHMFDVEVDGVAYRESEHEEPGEEVVVAEIPGAGPAGEPLRLGMTVCYDLRFPELYRVAALRGARAFTVPSAFTKPTGRAHWEVLVRARAIENAAFVLAADQFGPVPPNHDSWGHSMVVDPWGRVLAEVAEGEGIAVADLDLAEQERVRSSLPSLANRRPAAYRWPEEARV
jgi:deaminated glutathione amidase